MLDEITIIIVHFKTLDYTKKALNSIRKFYPPIRIILVNNGDDEESKSFLTGFAHADVNMLLLTPGKNLHHGPGMHEAIKQVSSEWFLTFDSDCEILKNNLFEDMFQIVDEKTYAVGEILNINKYGFFARKGEESFKYVHPKCGLFNRKIYWKLPPFEKHGAPCITNQFQAQKDNYSLINFPVDDYVHHVQRGTASIYGYKLGLKGRLNWIKNKFFS